MRYLSTTFVLAALLPGIAFGQVDPVEDEDAPRWYQIEVLFFHNLAAANQKEEQWPTERKLEVAEGTIEFPQFDREGLYIEPVIEEPSLDGEDSKQPAEPELSTSSTDAGGELPTDQPTASEPEPLPPYIYVPQEERALQKARERMGRHNNYAVIDYQAWRQVLVPEGEPLVFAVKSGDQYGEAHELEGQIGFYLRRYLHTFADLWLTEYMHVPTSIQPDAPSWYGDNNNSLYGDSNTQTASDFSMDFGTLFADEYSVLQSVSLRQKRRMRSNETHYLDHPLFGVMVRITPWEPPLMEEPGSEAAETSGEPVSSL